jgi:hypothetical protein
MNKPLLGTLTGAFILFTGINALNLSALAQETAKMNENIEKVEIESFASSAKAMYLPKKVCIIQVDEKVPIPELRKYLASCLHSHQKWLELNSSTTVEDKK